MPESFGPAETLATGGQALTIRVCHGTRSAIVAIDGESDAVSAHRLGAELRALCSRHPLVVVNCLGLTFLGSAGLAVFLDAHLHAEARRHVLRFVINTPAVLAVLRLSGTDRLLDVFGTMNDALTV